jgi:heme/copper-type cytochrome/quinol oxidase subunit 3
MNFYILKFKKFLNGLVDDKGWFKRTILLLKKFIRNSIVKWLRSAIPNVFRLVDFFIYYIPSLISRYFRSLYADPITRALRDLILQFIKYLLKNPYIKEFINKILKLVRKRDWLVEKILQRIIYFLTNRHYDELIHKIINSIMDSYVIMERILEDLIALIILLRKIKPYVPLALRMRRYIQYLKDSNPLNTLHPFHMVDPSPWPIMAALGAFFFTSGMIACMHNYKVAKHMLPFGILLLFYVIYSWSRDIIREGLDEEKHNSRVKTGLTMGFVLFVVSEVMLFFSFFWAFFYFSSSPVFNSEIAWPPKAVTRASVSGLPLLNTVLLLISGISVTWAHHSSTISDKKNAVLGLSYTIFFAVLFLGVQLYEYKAATFNMSDSVYGSCFYILTGCHGVHVFVGTIGIIVTLIRTFNNNFTTEQHLGLECAIWYWHFVDVVWLLVFIIIYWWG